MIISILLHVYTLTLTACPDPSAQAQLASLSRSSRLASRRRRRVKRRPTSEGPRWHLAGEGRCVLHVEKGDIRKYVCTTLQNKNQYRLAALAAESKISSSLSSPLSLFSLFSFSPFPPFLFHHLPRRVKRPHTRNSSTLS